MRRLRILLHLLLHLTMPLSTSVVNLAPTIPCLPCTGGKGANQAAAAARAGFPTFFVGQFGRDDPNASLLRNALLGCGVDLTHAAEVDGPCGTALILLQVACGRAGGGRREGGRAGGCVWSWRCMRVSDHRVSSMEGDR